MLNHASSIERIRQTNRRLKGLCAALGAVILLGVGIAQRGPDKHEALVPAGQADGAVAVHDSTGFAVFVRSDGNLVIVKSDGQVIQTKNQPMAVSF